jgi:hypothetical protein
MKWTKQAILSGDRRIPFDYRGPKSWWFAKAKKKDDLPIGSVGGGSRLEPKAGEQWRLSPTEADPWPQREPSPVKILDVKDGWVRYRLSEVFPDERKTIKDFLQIYQHV